MATKKGITKKSVYWYHICTEAVDDVRPLSSFLLYKQQVHQLMSLNIGKYLIY